VQLTAANPLGVLHGLQTFLQLVKVTHQGFSVPVAAIDDSRFSWRGLMLDTGRHFMPVPVIERTWTGWKREAECLHWIFPKTRIPHRERQFPLLHEKGSGGLYYTQKQVGEVIQYARERGIRVVAEFDMPCHTTSWSSATSAGQWRGSLPAETRWGIFDPAMDPTRESTYQFLDKFWAR